MSFLVESTVYPTITLDDNDECSAICAPSQADWTGGDNLLMVLPQLDRNKGIHSVPCIILCFLSDSHRSIPCLLRLYRIEPKSLRPIRAR